SDLPFRNAFPLLLRNTVAYLVAQRTNLVQEQYQIGDSIEPLRGLPTGVKVTVSALRHQKEKARNLSLTGGSFLFDDTKEAGPLKFAAGEESAYTVVNLTDAQESRIAPVKAVKPPEEALSLTGRLFGT